MSERLFHACKQTCSGYKAGFDDGKEEFEQLYKAKVEQVFRFAHQRDRHIRLIGLAVGALKGVQAAPTTFNMMGLETVLKELETEVGLL